MKRPKNTVLPPCLREEPLAAREVLLRVAPRDVVAGQQAPAPLAGGPVAEVVADDRGGDSDDEHDLDRQRPLRGEDGARDQRGLARHGKPERLQSQKDEEEHECPRLVVLDERQDREEWKVSHRSWKLLTAWAIDGSAQVCRRGGRSARDRFAGRRTDRAITSVMPRCSSSATRARRTSAAVESVRGIAGDVEDHLADRRVGLGDEAGAAPRRYVAFAKKSSPPKRTITSPGTSCTRGAARCCGTGCPRRPAPRGACPSTVTVRPVELRDQRDEGRGDGGRDAAERAEREHAEERDERECEVSARVDAVQPPKPAHVDQPVDRADDHGGERRLGEPVEERRQPENRRDEQHEDDEAVELAAHACPVRRPTLRDRLASVGNPWRKPARHVPAAERDQLLVRVDLVAAAPARVLAAPIDSAYEIRPSTSPPPITSPRFESRRAEVRGRAGRTAGSDTTATPCRLEVERTAHGDARGDDDQRGRKAPGRTAAGGRSPRARRARSRPAAIACRRRGG